MYKKILTILFMTLLLTGIGHWADVITWSGWVTVVNPPKEDVVLTETISTSWIGWELWWVQLKFCNDWVENLTNKINWMINQMENWEICLLANNTLDKDIEVIVTFTDAIKTSAWSLTCKVSKDNNFSKFIDEPNSTIKVPAGNYNIKKYNVKFPIWTNWKQAWCLYYSVAKAEKDAWMINIVVWKTMFLDYFVWALGEIKNNIEIKILNKEVNNNNEFIVNAAIVNDWNIDIAADVFWSMTNVLWVNKTFNLTWQTIRTDDSLSFSLNFWQLPSYKGPFNIELKATHKPFFDFDISWFDIDPKLLEEKTTVFNTTYFEMPRLILGVALFIILLLFFVFKKRKPQVVYVQQPTAQ